PRNLLPDALELFDFPDNAMVHGAREMTLVPGQSLYWMNSQSVDRAAQQIAVRVFPGYDLFPRPKPRWTPVATQSEPAYKPPQKQIDIAARFADVTLLTLSRLPLAEENAAVEQYVKDQKAQSASDGVIWTSICRAILSSADFRR